MTVLSDRECQKEDYRKGNPTHRSICGKVLTSEMMEQAKASFNEDAEVVEILQPSATFQRPPALLHQIQFLRKPPYCDYIVSKFTVTSGHCLLLSITLYSVYISTTKIGPWRHYSVIGRSGFHPHRFGCRAEPDGVIDRLEFIAIRNRGGVLPTTYRAQTLMLSPLFPSPDLGAPSRCAVDVPLTDAMGD
jgi:hypothetical protein